MLKNPPYTCTEEDQESEWTSIHKGRSQNTNPLYTRTKGDHKTQSNPLYACTKGDHETQSNPLYTCTKGDHETQSNPLYTRTKGDQKAQINCLYTGTKKGQKTQSNPLYTGTKRGQKHSQTLCTHVEREFRNTVNPSIHLHKGRSETQSNPFSLFNCCLSDV